MVCQTQDVEEVIPIYKIYLKYMVQFYEKITDFDSWCNTALKNLKKRAKTKDWLIYIMKQSNTVIGFAMVNKHLRFNDDGFAIAEFYIQQTHQRKGYGIRLAHHVFSRLPGSWEVCVTAKNSLAVIFWKQAVSTYTLGKYTQKTNCSTNVHGFVFKQ